MWPIPLFKSLATPETLHGGTGPAVVQFAVETATITGVGTTLGSEFPNLVDSVDVSLKQVSCVKPYSVSKSLRLPETFSLSPTYFPSTSFSSNYKTMIFPDTSNWKFLTGNSWKEVLFFPLPFFFPNIPRIDPRHTVQEFPLWRWTPGLPGLPLFPGTNKPVWINPTTCSPYYPYFFPIFPHIFPRFPGSLHLLFLPAQRIPPAGAAGRRAGVTVAGAAGGWDSKLGEKIGLGRSWKIHLVDAELYIYIYTRVTYITIGFF